MRKLLCVSIILVLFFSCFASFETVEAQGNEGWLNRYSYDVDYGNGTHTSISYIGPQVFWDGSSWQELKFENRYATDGYFLIENSHITAKIYEWYSVFLNPDNQGVCVDDERWIVEVYAEKTGKWREVDLYNPILSYFNNGTHLTVTRTFDCPEGLFKITYIVWQGSWLKHDVVFQSRMANSNEFRVTMRLTGIYHDKVKHSEGEETIIGEKHVVSPYFFIGEDNNNLVLSEYLWALGEFNDANDEWTPTVLKDIIFSTHASGCKADIIIGNYTLMENEQLEIDPATDTWAVGAGSDDCHRRMVPSSFLLTLTEYYAGSYDADNYKYGAGMRFTNITIPQGSTIDSAYLKIYAVASLSGETCNTKISAEDVDDADTFADDATIFDTRYSAHTTAMVTWTVPAWTIDTWYTSPDIKTVIQEIKDRPGSASGNDIVIFWEDFDDLSSDVAYRRGESYEDLDENEAKLEVTWTSGAQNYVADLTQSISSSWSVLIQSSFKSDLSQSFSTSWTTLTQWNAIVDVSQSISTSWQVLTQTNFITDLTQTITSSWITSIQSTFTATLTQAITSTWTVTAGFHYIATLTQQITTSWTTTITYTFGGGAENAKALLMGAALIVLLVGGTMFLIMFFVLKRG